MMCNIAVITVFFLTQAHANETALRHVGGAQDRTETLFRKYLDRAREALPIHYSDSDASLQRVSKSALDATTLGKAGGLASAPCRTLSGVASFQRWSLRPQRCDILRARHRDDTVQSAVVTEQLGRRHSGLAIALGGLAAVAPQPRPALAKGEKVAMLDGPEGIKYADIEEGYGASPATGDTVKLEFKLKIAGANPNVKEMDSIFLGDPTGGYPISLGTGKVIKGLDMTVLGEGSMPAMKIGGMRKAIIPPELAYGAAGTGCPNSIYVPAGPCVVPPDTAVELTIKFNGIEGQRGGVTPPPNCIATMSC